MDSFYYPPYNFDCEHKNECPHLMGLSTHWVFYEYCRANEQYHQFLDIQDRFRQDLDNANCRIRDLEKENSELKAKLKSIHQRQFKANKPKKQCATSGQDDSKQNRKRGAPKGHPYWFRAAPTHIDCTVEVPAPSQCPHCNCKNLEKTDQIKEHLQEDIILQPKTRVTNFRHQYAFCPKCNRLVIQTAQNELPNCHIGPVTKAAAIYLRYGLGLPYRKVQRLFKDFFNLSFVPASAVNFDRQAVRNGANIYEDLKEKLRIADAAYCDETHWRQDGLNYYVWYGGNQDIDFFHIDRHRSQDVAKHLLGDDFDGVLIADGYAAYNGVNPIARQSCLAHLIRKADEIKNQILLIDVEHQDKKAIGFCEKIKQLFKDACKIGQQIRSDQNETKNASEYKAKFQRRLKKICKVKLSDANAQNLKDRLLDPKREYHRLFVFLDYPDIEPTNNHAERALRKLVIFRKICFGTRSDHGSYCHSVLPSLLSTAIRQGKHPIDFFHSLFVSDPATAQAELYNNSS